jgi:hypothetical protein
LEPGNFAHKASLRADMRRDWIITTNMEYQPLRYKLSGHRLARDYPRIYRVARFPLVNRPAIQEHSETFDANGCQGRIDQ